MSFLPFPGGLIRHPIPWVPQQQRNKSRSQPLPTYCPLCGFKGQDSVDFDLHIQEPRHIYNYFLTVFKKHRKRKAQNRHSVRIVTWCEGKEVTCTKDGTVKTVIVPEKQELEYIFEVINTGEKRNNTILLQQVMLLHPYKAFYLHDQYGVCDSKCQVSIMPGLSYGVKVTFKNCGIGTYGVPVCFIIHREDLPNKMFQIVRVMVVKVTGCLEEKQMEKKDSPFTGEVWLGMDFRYPGKTPDGYEIQQILEYSIPSDLKKLLERDRLPFENMDEYQVMKLMDLEKMLEGNVPENKEAYIDFFHTLLYMNEFAELKQVEQYNMADVTLTYAGENILHLEVPGLAEGRPSVLKGDILYLRVSFGEDTVERVQYEGIVTSVADTYICIGGFHEGFWERFLEDPLLHFDVHFTINRYSYFIMHRVLELMEEEPFDLVAPNGVVNPNLPIKGNIEFINPLIKKNPEQAKAVTNIIYGTSRPAPYIIHGPPGTGKTVTLVEAILQVKKMIRRSYILVCSTSNAACDLMAEKLVPYCRPEELLRLHSYSRDWNSVPEILHPYSNYAGEEYFFPRPNALRKYRIIVCTLINSGKLLPRRGDDGKCIEERHFTHIFIDECGQALEPATLVPVAGILTKVQTNYPGGQVIFAGDPMQLGPICSCRTAEKFLGISLMERLMTHKLYERKGDENELYDERYITKLRYNFRSHELILQPANELFYHGDLIPKCPSHITNDRVKNLHKNSKFNKPIVFHGVVGQEKREGKSPSYYNNYEVEVVLNYVTKLLSGENEREAIIPNEIGIIAPYIRQVYKIKAKLKDKNWEDIEVGTTETFQGREKRVIIITTVRSNRNLLDYDGKYRLGFVANPKRFNVAITRARSLLIVIGNPHLLELDQNWNYLVCFTKDVLKSYRGCKYTPRHLPEWTDYITEAMRRFEEVVKSEK